jgi:hypothetical protein
MSDFSWYDIIAEEALVQGDLLLACPVVTVSDPWSFPVQAKDRSYVVAEVTCIVMTQSCDLQNQKTDLALLAQVSNWQTAASIEYRAGNTAVKSRDFRKKLIEGNIPGLSLLHKHYTAPKLAWSIVDFHRLYTLPKSFLEQYAQSLGPRLRLRSPYREHLAQAFARYFMRVGLPHDAKAFEKEGDVAIGSTP